MPLQPIPFWTQSGEARSPVVTAERLVNWYLEKNPGNAKFPYALYPTPGLTRLVTLGNGPIRGMCDMGGYLWVVSGDTLYRVDSNYNTTTIGNIGSSGNVDMVTNNTHVLIVTNQQMYVADSDGVLEQPFRGMGCAAYQDGYAIVYKRTTEQFYISGVDDFTSWSALDFSSADTLPDSIVGLVSVQRQLLIFGEKTTEFWYNAGLASFPFSRSQTNEIGCKAKESIAVFDNAAFWLADDYHVYMTQGVQPQKISNSQIAKLIEEQPSPEEARAFVYSQQGHTFYVLTFTDKTIVFDAMTGTWHERKSESINRWRANKYWQIWNTHIVGDYANGKLYKLDLDAYDEDGDTIRREADSAPIHAAGDRVTLWEVLVDIDSGQGLTSGQGNDPELMLQWSDNGGRTWSNELTSKMGAVGEYGVQCRFHRLGAFRQRSLRIAVSDAVFSPIIGAYGRLEGRTS